MEPCLRVYQINLYLQTLHHLPFYGIKSHKPSTPKTPRLTKTSTTLKLFYNPSLNNPTFMADPLRPLCRGFRRKNQHRRRFPRWFPRRNRLNVRQRARKRPQGRNNVHKRHRKLKVRLLYKLLYIFIFLMFLYIFAYF
jgi:hypothetical protein